MKVYVSRYIHTLVHFSKGLSYYITYLSKVHPNKVAVFGHGSSDVSKHRMGLPWFTLLRILHMDQSICVPMDYMKFLQTNQYKGTTRNLAATHLAVTFWNDRNHESSFFQHESWYIAYEICSLTARSHQERTLGRHRDTSACTYYIPLEI